MSSASLFYAFEQRKDDSGTQLIVLLSHYPLAEAIFFGMLPG